MVLLPQLDKLFEGCDEGGIRGGCELLKGIRIRRGNVEGVEFGYIAEIGILIFFVGEGVFEDWQRKGVVAV